MPHQNKNLEKILSYILNEADQGELELIDAAVKRKMKKPFEGIDGMDFSQMAGEMVGELASKLGTGSDTHAMTRRLVTNMILEQAPNISVDELEILLDKWIPSASKVREGKEKEVPGDLIYSMAMQFVDYSLGRMPEREIRELKASMPDWTSRYWDIFSAETKILIKELLDGRYALNEFQDRLLFHLGLASS